MFERQWKFRTFQSDSRSRQRARSSYYDGDFRYALKFLRQSLESVIPKQTKDDNELQMLLLLRETRCDNCYSQEFKDASSKTSSFNYQELELEMGMQCFDLTFLDIVGKNQSRPFTEKIDILLPWNLSDKKAYDKDTYRYQTIFNMGLSYLQLCNEESATKVFRFLFERTSPRIDVDPLPILCLYHLARIEYTANNFEASFQLFCYAVTTCNSLIQNCTVAPGCDQEDLKYLHRLEAACLVGTAWIYMKIDDIDTALHCSKHALSLQTENLVSDSIEVAGTIYILGVIYHLSEDYDNAKKYYKSSLKRVQQTLGEEHPHTASVFHQIGNLLLNNDELDEAMSYFLRALKIRKDFFGQSNIHAARSLCSIGCVYSKQENFVDALEAFNNSLRVKIKALGKFNIETMETALLIGESHHKRGELRDALIIYRLVLKLASTVFGKKDLFVARIWKMIGIVQLESKGTAFAMEAFSEAIRIDDIFENDSSADIPDIVSASLLHLAGDQIHDAAAA